MNKIEITHLREDFSIAELKHTSWDHSKEICVNKYWSGEDAPVGRHFKTRLLWSPNSLYVRFEANQTERLIVSDVPNISDKSHGLWERDVCEIFIAPNKNDFCKYFEFEVAPNGEWIDLQVHQMPERRVTDFDYQSGMQTSAKIEDSRVWMAIKIDWKAFGKTPESGEVWKGNILRCVGSRKQRGYLAWQPTLTENPNFHVPDKFGEFEFVK